MPITPSAPICRPFTRPRSGVTRRTRGSAPGRTGGRRLRRSRRHSLILPFPGLFRFTCYYYRGAYYKGVLGGPARVRRGRAAQGLLGRESVASDLPERSPLFHVCRGDLPVHSVVRRLAGHAVLQPADRRHRVRHRSRHHRPRGERGPLDLLHAGLPRGASPRRWLPRRGVEAPGVRQGVRLLDGAQLQAPALCVVQPLLGGLRRHLRPALLDGHLDRCEVL